MGRDRSFVIAVAALGWLASCGGRAAETTAANAGSAAIAGRGVGAGAGGTTSTGSAGAGSPGASVDAGPSCPPCGPSTCPKGQTLDYPNYGACCSVCRDCTLEEQQAGGEPYDCGPAARRDYPFNSCYTDCIANDPAACSAQLSQYFLATEPLRAKYESACQSDADCASGFVDSLCEQDCFGARQDMIASYVAQVQQLGAACTACPLRRPAPASWSCQPTLNCYNHRCVNGIPL